VDAAGDLVVSGDFVGEVDFGAGVTMSTIENPGDRCCSADDLQGFVTKLSGGNGDGVWVRQFDSAYDNGVSVNSRGNVLATGSFRGSMSVGSLALAPLQTPGAGLAAFLLELNGTDGATVCARGFGSSDGEVRALRVTTDRSATGADRDLTHVEGVFTGTLDPGDGVPPLVGPPPVSPPARFRLELRP
jgi:hypothetical protein